MRRVSLALLLVFLAACSSDANTSTGATTTLAGESTTTVVNAAATSPTTAPATPTPIAPTTTTIAVISTPAARQPTGWEPGPQDPQVIAELGVCEPFYEALAGGPYTIQRCGVWNAYGAPRMWTVTRGVTGFLFAFIWQPSGPNTWLPVLRMQEPTPGQWDDVTILTGNTDSGPNDELVSGVHIHGVSERLSVALIDVRSGTPRVLAVLPIGNHGVALLRTGVGIEMWSAVEAEGVPNCCPLNFVQSFLVAIDGDWFINSGATVPADDPSIPPTQF